MIRRQYLVLLGVVLKMFNSKKTDQLRKMLFSGNEQDRMISAGVMRTIFSDITRLYFENRQAIGKGCLIFNPEDPAKSKFLSRTDLQRDVALAEEDMNEDFANGFKKILNVIDNHDNDDMAIVVMVYTDGLAVNLIDPERINETIDEISNGLIT